MIDRIYGKIVFICDTCEDSLETETSDFNAALMKMMRAGWKSVKEQGQWNHRCGDCQ